MKVNVVAIVTMLTVMVSNSIAGDEHLPIAGKFREEFVTGFLSSCISKTKADPLVITWKMSDLAVSKVCSCSAMRSADGISNLQLVKLNRTGDATQIQPVLTEASQYCWAMWIEQQRRK